MLNGLVANPIITVIYLFGLVVAVTIHEFAHAFAAEKLGDPTPRLMGRLTLNPLAHLDPIGTLMLLIVRFGWGKPVQFDPFNLANPRRDAAIISLAGPASNLILAIILALFMQTIPLPYAINFLITVLITINVVLALFNLIPIHPLDGFGIVSGLLPQDKAHEWESLKPYGVYMLLLLLLPFGPGGALVHFFLDAPLDFILKLLMG